MQLLVNPSIVRLMCGLFLFALLVGPQKIAVLMLVGFMLLCGACHRPWHV